MKLTDTVTLGRTGLRVSPLCFGTMTFGTDWGWGTDDEGARSLFNHYVDQGGNFFDTADAYVGGKSEELVGRFVRERKLREKLVIATKFSLNTDPGNQNGGGNGRKNIHRAHEASLRRLGTDYVDLYWLHLWDMTTPLEEVAETLDSLVQRGLVRYVGLSNVPAWYAARYQTLAERDRTARVAALQLEYSLVERSIEREYFPMARELGIGITPWGPLASGFLSGKYRREGSDVEGTGRLNVLKGNPVFDKFTDKNFRVLDVLDGVAKELGRPPAEVALAWVVGRREVTSTLIGATKLAQLESNLRALELEIPSELSARLDAVSALEPAQPYSMFGEPFQGMLRAGP
jgi:aryl-alcohol dehydrogenase-like predicted oxidoreductase